MDIIIVTRDTPELFKCSEVDTDIFAFLHSYVHKYTFIVFIHGIKIYLSYP